MITRPLERDLSLAPIVMRLLRCAAMALAIGMPAAAFAKQPNAAPGEQPSGQAQAIVYKVQGANDRLEMVVNSSRILTMELKVPEVQVANPDVVELTPLSATQVQILAKKQGVTQVNLWDEQQKIHTVDVIVYPDARELSMLLQAQFPSTALKVVPTANSVIISGHVDDPNQISRIIQIAEDFYPKVINNITIAGVQQVLLKVKVMEISRTRMRNFGVDMKYISNGGFFESSISELLSKVASDAKTFTIANNDTMAFGVLNSNSSFFGFLDALRLEQMASIMAEPNLTAYSGRPAKFNSGGEFPIIVPQSLGTVSFQYKPYGTQVEFVPIVLGNGAIRLEVYPRVSEIDPTMSVTFNGFTVPALKVREANTGVELRAGQTLALAGLVQNRRVYSKRSVPWLGEVPYLGALFSDKKGEDEEVELLLLVTPQWIEAMEPCEVPPGGPGTSTSSPNDVELYLKGHIEVPRCPQDDACAPSRSPGSLYEFSRPQGLPPGGAGSGPVGPGGPGSIMPVPEGETIETPRPDPGVIPRPSARAKAPPVANNKSGGPVTSTASAPPSMLYRDMNSPAERTANKAAAADLDNRSISFEANNRARRAAAENGPPRQSVPGLIGPVGYDLKQ